VLPPPYRNTITGSFEAGVAVSGAHTFMKRQSSPVASSPK
jgi:hypothetical protein